MIPTGTASADGLLHSAQEQSVSVAAQIARKRPFALVLFRWEARAK
jgi:hypothetical protein